MTRQAPKCPKCHSRMILEYGTWKCLADGQELEDQAARHQFYEEHKDEIVADYQAGGFRRLTGVWGISPSSWFALRKRWNVELQKVPRAALAPASKNGYPELPAFSDKWTESVQVKWLEVWAAARKVTY